MAHNLELSEYIPSLEVTRRKRRTDKHKLAQLMLLWRTVRPTTYNVNTLLRILDMQVMTGRYSI